MNILKDKSAQTIQKHVWEKLFAKIDNEEMRRVAEAIGKLYLESYSKGTKAFGYNKNSDVTLFQQRENAINKILEGTNFTQNEKVKLLDICGMLHKTYEFSQLKAAFNSGNMQKIVDDMVGEVSIDLPDVNQMIEHFQRVVVDRVLTAHPTFVGKLDYAILMRDLQNAISENDTEKMDSLFERFMSPDFSAVVDKNLTVADETDFMIHYLSGIAKDLPQLYALIDKAMRAKFGAAYNPADLILNINFGDWGSSGDKDGNLNVTAATLQAGIPKRRKAAAQWHIDNLEKIEAPEAAALSARLKTIETLDAAGIAELKNDLEDFYAELYEDEEHQAALDGMRNLRHIGLSLGYIEMRETAEQFKYVIGRFMLDSDIEKIIGVKLGYEALADKQKEQLINALLQPEYSELVAQRIKEAMSSVPEEAKADGYKYQDTGKTNNAIFYNTIQRLLIAKDNPDIFPGQQVLAEAQNPQQIKEMLLLLQALGLEKKILIVPLFEEPELLMDMDNLIENILGDEILFKYYVNHSLERLEKSDIKLPKELIEKIRNLSPKDSNFSKQRDEINGEIKAISNGKLGIEDILNFQIQFAHSDNGRRGGTTAARSAIGNSQRIAVECGRKFGFSITRYQGGSYTDSNRDGGRDLRAKLNVHDIHDSTGHMNSKATVQGMDIFTLLNGALSTVAFLGETLTHLLKSNERWNGQEYITPKKRNMAHFANAATPVQRIINIGYGQLEYYKQMHFAHPRLAEAMDQIFKYTECKEAGTVGSRAGERVQAAVDAAKKSLATDATKVRTIGYSEAGQHEHCHFGFIGAGALRAQVLFELKELAAELIAKQEAFNGRFNQPMPDFSQLTERETEIFFESAGKLGLTPTEAFDLAFLTKGSLNKPMVKSDAEILKSLYDNSPTFRDSIDRNAEAVAKSTDFDKIWKNAMRKNDVLENGVLVEVAKELHIIDPKTGETVSSVKILKRPEPSQLESWSQQRDTMQGYLAGLELDCRKASHLAIEAMTGRSFELSDDISTTELKLKVMDLIPDKGRILAGDIMHSFAHILRDSVKEDKRCTKFNTTVHHTVDFAVLSQPKPQAIGMDRGRAAA